MPDFITKSKPDEEFNNGGSTLGKSGGLPVDGPQSPLSETDQSDTISNLNNQDTASYQQSSSGSGDNASPQQPCPSPKTKPLIELTISDSMNRLYDGYTSGSVTWDLFSTAVFDGIIFNNSECGCYVSILSLSDLLGGVIVGKLAIKFIRRLGGYKRVHRNIAIANTNKIFNKYSDVYRFKRSRKMPDGGVKFIHFDGDSYTVYAEETRKRLDDLIERYQNNIRVREAAMKRIRKPFRNLDDASRYTELEFEVRNLNFGIDDIRSARSTFENYNFALETEIDNEATRLLNDPHLIMTDETVQKAFLDIFEVSLTAALFQGMARKKVCYGNAVLNDNCECVCPDDSQNCGYISEGAWQLAYDYAMPAMFPTTNELRMCHECGCNMTAEYLRTNPLRVLGECYCADCKDGYTWKPGKNCPCTIYTAIPMLGILAGRGICIEDSVINSPSNSLYRTWGGDRADLDYVCSFVCPPGSDEAEGRSCGLYARLEDNLSESIPSVGYQGYASGCNCVCDGRQKNSTDMFNPWPPVCPDGGYVFDYSPTVCACVPCPVRQYTCTDQGTAVSCDECPEGYECNGVEGSDAYICSKVTEVASAVESSEDCVALLGAGSFPGQQWSAGWYCV